MLINPMLLNVLESGANVSGWMASEKLDGWRAIWDGSQLYTRHGRTLDAPKWWRAGLPDAVLDGELYAGQDGCGAVVSAVQLGDWHRLTFHAFDAPLHFGTFAKRAEYVRQVCDGTTARIVTHTPVADYFDARQFAREVYQRGGEGAVFRKPDARYRAGCRSQDVLKCRPGEGM